MSSVPNMVNGVGFGSLKVVLMEYQSCVVASLVQRSELSGPSGKQVCPSPHPCE